MTFETRNRTNYIQAKKKDSKIVNVDYEETEMRLLII